MSLFPELTGNPEVIKLSAALLDRPERSCPAFAAAKSRPDLRPRTTEQRRRAPYESFPLGPLMRVLDTVESRGTEVDVALRQVLGGWSNPVHPGADRWIRHSAHAYLEAAEQLHAELAAEGVTLRPERSPRVVQHGDGAALRALTAWGRWYGSPDGGVVEFRRLRFRRPLGRADSPGTLAMAFIAAFGRPVTDPREVYRAVPIPVHRDAPRPTRVRVVEVGLTDGIAQVLVDAAPDEIRRAYQASGRPVAERLVQGTERSPGAECAECKLRAACPALAQAPGLLGLADPGTHRRICSTVTLQRYALCPAQAHLQDLRLPTDPVDSAVVRRGLLVHRWLEQAHRRGAPCRPEDLPSPDAPDLGPAAGLMDRDEYAAVLPYLRRHLDVCPLRGPGEITEVSPEPRVTAYDPTADVLVLARPDLLRRVDGQPVWREQKTSLTDRGITPENVLDLVPQLALAVCLLADGVFGEPGGLAELEQLTPDAGRVITLDAGDPAVVSAARAVLADRARDWHRDTEFPASPGPWCRLCPVARWCPDALDPEDEAAQAVHGLVIDPATGEILPADGRADRRAEAVADAVQELDADDEPAF